MNYLIFKPKSSKVKRLYSIAIYIYILLLVHSKFQVERLQQDRSEEERQ
jgi:hypothetical protein